MRLDRANVLFLTARTPRVFTAIAIIVMAGTSLGQFPPATPGQNLAKSPAAASAPVSAPASRPGEFQPGVKIDWEKRAVRLRAQVALRAGPVEFLACRPGKEHESLLLLEANATHIFMAMGLIGLEPGSPPRWDERANKMSSATGQLLDVQFAWTADGKQQSADWAEWLLDAEFLRPPLSRPLIFSGSILRPDRSVACEKSGAVFALVDMPDALVSPARSRSDREADLWALANPKAMPEMGIEIELIISAAKPRQWKFAIGPIGQTRVDGRYEHFEDFVELLQTQRRFSPEKSIAIESSTPLRSDEWRLEESLKKAGVPEESFQIKRSTTQPTSP